MIAKTEAIVLRIVPFSQTSHVVYWLTPHEGRLATVIKGALRPKSPFLGQYDLFQSCELLYYEREHDGLHIARECSPLDARAGLRRGWRAAACASYVADLLWRVSVGGPHHEELYALAELTLDALAGGAPLRPALFAFELRLALALGLAPQFERCAACGGSVRQPPARVFGPAQGGLLCPACAPAAGARGLPAPPDAVAIMRHWLSLEAPAAAGRTRCREGQLHAISRMLERFLHYHLDIDLRPRYIALDMVTAETGTREDCKL